MLDKEEKCNIIESSSLYFMNIFPFVQWPKKKFYNFIQKELDAYLGANLNYNQENLYSQFLQQLENKIIVIIAKELQLPKHIDIIQGLIDFIKINDKYNSYAKLQQVSTIFTNKLRSSEYYLNILKQNNSILEIIELNINLNRAYIDVVDPDKKKQLNLIAQDQKLRNFVEDYCIANDIDELHLFDNNNEVAIVLNNYKLSRRKSNM